MSCRVSAAQYPLQKDSSITNSSSHLSNYFGQQPKAILFSLTSLMIGIIRESLPSSILYHWLEFLTSTLSVTRMMEVGMVYENLLDLRPQDTRHEQDAISWPLTSTLEY